MAKIDKLFQKMVALEASDLHMTSGRIPKFRLHGDMVDVEGAPEINAEQMLVLLYEITSDEDQKTFEDTGDLDFAYEVQGLLRIARTCWRASAPAAWMKFIRMFPRQPG